MINRRPPIIIIGMHRSGTRLLVQLLEGLGLFMGHRQINQTKEARFFVHLNAWILRQAHGHWDQPEPIHYLYRNEKARHFIKETLRLSMKRIGATSFMGLRKYGQVRSIMNLNVPWGWKDPRNTFTLPFWLDLFPEAKVIHLYRHKVDVANSLKVREEKYCYDGKSWGLKRRLLSLLLRRELHFARSVRCLSDEGSLSLWDNYVKEARGHVLKLGTQAIEISYEELVLNSKLTLQAAASFCGLEAKEADIIKLSRVIDQERAYAHRKERNQEAMFHT